MSHTTPPDTPTPDLDTTPDASVNSLTSAIIHANESWPPPFCLIAYNAIKVRYHDYFSHACAHAMMTAKAMKHHELLFLLILVLTSTMPAFAEEPSPAWTSTLKFSTPRYAIIIGDPKAVWIDDAGRVTLAKRADLDAATRLWWENVEKLAPGICQKILDERGEEKKR